MPIPISHMKERLSVAYVRTVTAKAGATFLTTDGTEYGTDASIQRVNLLPNGRYTGTGWTLHCQLKSTTTWSVGDDKIIYDMEVDAYNKLVCWEGSPCILVLFRLPKNEEEWVNLDELKLELRNCCYWTHLVGEPSTNLRTTRIEIPRTQLFNPDAVNYLLNRLADRPGEALLNENTLQ